MAVRSFRRQKEDGTFADVFVVRGGSAALRFHDIQGGTRGARLQDLLAGWRYRRTAARLPPVPAVAIHRLEHDLPAARLFPDIRPVLDDGEHLVSANSLIVSRMRDLAARGWLRIADGQVALAAPPGEDRDSAARLLALLCGEDRLAVDAGTTPGGVSTAEDGVVRAMLAADPGARLADLPPTRGLVFNTAFFLLEADDVASHHSAIGQPYGLWVDAGVIRRPPLYPRGTILHDPKAGWRIGRFSLRDVAVMLPAGLTLVPRPHALPDQALPCSIDAEDDVTLYTRAGGDGAYGVRDRTPTDSRRLELTVIDRRVTGWKAGGDLAIPQNGFIVSIVRSGLSGRLTDVVAAAACEPVGYRFLDQRMDDTDRALQAGPILSSPERRPLNECYLRTTECFRPSWTDGDGRRHAGIVPTDYAPDVDRTSRPRTAVGISRRGELLVALAAGVEPEVTVPGTDSSGMTLQEIAGVLQEAGACSALNFDGGGSTQAYMDGRRLVDPGDRRGVWDKPLERYVPSVGLCT